MIVPGGCSSGGPARDKAGGPGEPVVLRMASASGDLRLHPALEYFVARVDDLSGGQLRIEMAQPWGNFGPDAEQLVIRAVAGGETDLGWAGTRVFDTIGVLSFQALTAPMLIDSYALQDAVIEAGITDEMMQEVDDLGVVGLGVLPDGLRKPIGVAGHIMGPADWREVDFGTLMSNGQGDAIRALGARPTVLTGTYRDEAAAYGTIQGFELSLALYDSTMVHAAPYVTANVNLWPLMDVLLANPERLARLTAEQREWLEAAADDAAGRSSILVDKDAEVIPIACATGARFAVASADDLAALRDAVAPVYAQLKRDPSTRVFIERIQALKRSTPAEPAPVIPAGCTGSAAEQEPGPSEVAPVKVDGTYRYVITLDEAREADMVDPEDQYPQTITWTLVNGRFTSSGGLAGTYSVEGDRITFDSPDFGYTLTFTVAVARNGSMELTPVQPMDPGDAFVWSQDVWTKVE